MFSIIHVYIQKNRKELDEKPHTPGPHLLGRLESLSEVHSLFTLVTAVIISVFLIALLFKEPNHYMAKITNLLPTSGILIILGMFSGIISYYSDKYFHTNLSPIHIPAEILQHVLIFPILLYTSYKLYSQQFLRQFKSVVILSVFGTILNVLLTGLLLAFIHDASWIPSMTILQSMVFASCISVVDPLAVVAVFNGAREAKGNYFLPFGSALFGYGVAMELFKAANILAMFGEDDEIPMSSYLFVITSNFTDPVLGILIGVSCGLVSAAITRYISIECEYFEPVVTLGCALFGYVLCVDFGFSYIFATISCGLVQERYTFMNMSPKSVMSTDNIIFALSLISELLMFVLVGYLVVYVGFYDVWDFAIAAIIIIYTIRMFVTLGLSLLLNVFRLSTISFKWQLLIFGGHRGPMSLAMIVAYVGPFHELFKEATLLVIVFSVMVDGVICRYIATHLKLRRDFQQSAANNLLVQSSIYGGGELGNLLGMAKRTNYFLVIERIIFRFFIADKDKLTNVYRMQLKEKKRQFFQLLEKHSSKHEIVKIEVSVEGHGSCDAVDMEVDSIRAGAGFSYVQ